jgi:hypothetical protein
MLARAHLEQVLLIHEMTAAVLRLLPPPRDAMLKAGDRPRKLLSICLSHSEALAEGL